MQRTQQIGCYMFVWYAIVVVYVMLSGCTVKSGAEVVLCCHAALAFSIFVSLIALFR